MQIPTPRESQKNNTVVSPRHVDVVAAGEFDAVVGAAAHAVVKFGAAWCPPCRALEPTLEAVVNGRDVVVVSVDADEAVDLSARYGVRGLPTLIAFRHGKPVGQLTGNVPRAKLEELLAR